jgi:hypothetical protein
MLARLLRARRPSLHRGPGPARSGSAPPAVGSGRRAFGRPAACRHEEKMEAKWFVPAYESYGGGEAGPGSRGVFVSACLDVWRWVVALLW